MTSSINEKSSKEVVEVLAGEIRDGDDGGSISMKGEALEGDLFEQSVPMDGQKD